MNRICGYSCQHNKGGVCQITICDKNLIISNKTSSNPMNFVSCSQKIITKIISNQEKETLKVIERYCEENNIIPNIIEKEKLDLVLRLRVAEYNKRFLEKEK